MERRSFVRGAGMAGVLAAGIAPAVHAQPTIRWRLSSSFPKSLDTLYGVSEHFATLVSDMSGGKFQIAVHAPGELVPALGKVEAVQNGTVEMANTAPYYYFDQDETFAFGCAVPFGLNMRQMTAWYFEGNGLKLMRDFYRKYNIVNFAAGSTGAQMGGWFRKKIKSMADVKGLKFRVGGFGGRVFERLGGLPQSLPGGEVYQALEKGTIDAAEWFGPYDDLKLGFYKVAPFYAYPGWWEGGPQLENWINARAWDGLSSEYKAMIEAASTCSLVEMMAKYDARNAAALKQLVSAGAKLFPFPKVMMDAAFKESMALCSELSANNAGWKKVYDDYADFRRDVNLWFRYTEATFDEFMQRQRL